MQHIAVLLTCFNRKEKTLNALNSVYRAHRLVENSIVITIYLTDDGSTDGTGEAVKSKYPEVNILQGNGELYWAGGMRNSWKAALKGGYDAYLLLNDDTETYKTLFTELLETHSYCLKTYNQDGVYIGSTLDKKINIISYGGEIIINKFLAKSIKLIPNMKTPQKCDLGNANIMLVAKSVVNQIGILSDSFIHGLADFDYTLKAKRANIPVLITPNVLGECTNDHKNPYQTFHQLNFRQRLEKLYSPIGLDFKSNLLYMRRNFPLRVPFVFLAGWIKIIFPKFYGKTHKKRLTK